MHRGDDLKAFKASIPSLQVAASFACSVASLSRSPAFQLPGHHHLHGEVLADHQFDWGGLSTCTAAHAQCLLTPSPSQNLQESPPSKSRCFASLQVCVGKAHMHDLYAIRHGDVSSSLVSVLSGLLVLSLFVSERGGQKTCNGGLRGGQKVPNWSE